ncbi:MAG: SAM-dependent methyltransferase [Burkholderiales bacterium]
MKLPYRLVCAGMALGASLGVASENVVKDGGPYVPTPQVVVNAMLEVAGVGPRDFVVDLGSGDGRIVLTGATRHRASGMGVDIDGELVDLANASAQRLGVAERVQFHRQDVFAADLSRATVLTLYLLPGMMERLRPKLLKELKPGARIVSHDFDFGEWKPDRSVDVQTPEKYEISGSWSSTVHLWIVPAAVEGAWVGSVVAGGRPAPFRLEFKQRFQHFEGRLVRDAQVAVLRDAQIEGARIRFSVPGADGRLETYTGTVQDGSITGDARAGGGTAAVRWSAIRAP